MAIDFKQWADRLGLSVCKTHEVINLIRAVIAEHEAEIVRLATEERGRIHRELFPKAANMAKQLESELADARAEITNLQLACHLIGLEFDEYLRAECHSVGADPVPLPEHPNQRAQLVARIALKRAANADACKKIGVILLRATKFGDVSGSMEAMAQRIVDERDAAVVKTQELREAWRTCDAWRRTDFRNGVENDVKWGAKPRDTDGPSVSDYHYADPNDAVLDAYRAEKAKVQA